MSSNLNLRVISALLRRYVFVFDPVLIVALGLILTISALNMASAGNDFDGRLEMHMRNIAMSVALMWVMANFSPRMMLRIAVPLFLVGVALLIGVALFGEISKGARRWLDIKVARIQPSELLKIGMPLMLAWFFHTRKDLLFGHYVVAALLLAVPVVLIARQPDLGTAILVASSGFYVIFFAGLPWKVIFGGLLAGLAALPIMWNFIMHDYQRQRVLTLIDPTQDALGKGFHIIQSEIAVGSGGLFGKGWGMGTQTHLEFIPERTTDFIFSVFGEEHGFVGAAVLLILYLVVIARGLSIASQATTLFSRLMAGALTLSFFTYAFVNMGMVTGVLPVVGVPLPMMSYGGTAMITLGLAVGIQMSIARQTAQAKALQAFSAS